MKNIIQPSPKSLLTPLGLTAAASSATDTGMWYIKKILGLGTTTPIISNDEREDTMKLVKHHEDSGLLLKEVSETIQNKVKKEKGGFLSMLLGPLVLSLLGNMLAGKGINKAGQEIIIAGYGLKRSVNKNC